MSIGIGDPAPGLELVDTGGEPHTLPLPGEAPATVVAWTCNHCPYALAWHGRIQAAARDYADRGVRFLQVNSNDAGRYPADSLDAMRARVEAGDFAGPYLHDPTQEVARAYGALKTPDLFVLDSELRLAYRGAPDSDYQDESLNAGWLRNGLDALLAGGRLDPAETEPVGCGVKWRS